MLLIIIKLYSYSKRIGKITYNKIKDSNRNDLCVFIRSFNDDKIKIDNNSFFRPYYLEEAIDRFFSNDKLIMGIGEPGEVIYPEGITRYYVNASENWETEITKFLLKASLILTICPQKTAGIKKEFDLIKELGIVHKVIFIIPPLREEELIERISFISDTFEQLYGLTHQLFDKIDTMIAFKVKQNNEVLIITINEKDIEKPVSYHSSKNAYKIALSYILD